MIDFREKLASVRVSLRKIELAMALFVQHLEAPSFRTNQGETIRQFQSLDKDHISNKLL